MSSFDDVPAFFRGRVIPADLEAKILDVKQKVSNLLWHFLARCVRFSHFILKDLMWFLQGYVPLFVNATAGSTVYGAFDPINEIADICEKYNLWLHVDVSRSAAMKVNRSPATLLCNTTSSFVQGAWGGGLLMSRKHRHKLNGVERYFLEGGVIFFLWNNKSTRALHFAEQTQSRGIHIRWWASLCSVQPSWSERRYRSKHRNDAFTDSTHSLDCPNPVGHTWLPSPHNETVL